MRVAFSGSVPVHFKNSGPEVIENKRKFMPNSAEQEKALLNISEHEEALFLDICTYEHLKVRAQMS